MTRAVNLPFKRLRCKCSAWSLTKPRVVLFCSVPVSVSSCFDLIVVQKEDYT